MRLDHHKRALWEQLTFLLLNCRVVHEDGCGTDWLTMTFNVILPQSRLERTLARFDREEIPWRRWWGLGCHRHPAFANCPGTDLPVTTSLAPRVIGVPFFDSITHEQIEAVCTALEGSS